MGEKEWWELLEWENMHETWKRLPMEIRIKLRDMGKAPSWDNLNSKQKENDLKDGGLTK